VEFGFEPVCDQLRACRDSSNLLETGLRPGRSQIPLRYLDRSWFGAGRGFVADLLARANSLLAS